MNAVVTTKTVESNNVWIVEAFTAESLGTLLSELPLAQEYIRMYGKDVPTPRLTSWHGCGDYTFSGKTLKASKWTPALARIRAAVSARCGVEFNSCLANYYRDGSDSVGWHADNEPVIGPTIASVSIGGKRRFLVRENATKEKIEYALGGGSLLVMDGIQDTHQHTVPKTKKAVEPRLNLTFRVRA